MTGRAFPLVFASLFLATGVATVARAEDQKTLNATVVDAKADKAPAPAAAGEPFTDTTCTQGKNKRSVTMSFGNAQTKLPCEVHYKKDTEQPGHDQVIYKASNEVSFCDAKAHSFVEKLSGMGWSCGKS